MAGYGLYTRIPLTRKEGMRMLALLIIISTMFVEIIIITGWFEDMDKISIPFLINFLLVLALLALHIYEC